VRMASQLVKDSLDICGEGQEWYGRRTIERMRAEADAESSTTVKCVVGSSAGSMVKAEADSKRNQASQDQEATKRIDSAHRALEARKAIEAAERLGAAERAMAAREKEHSATLQRQREEERRREDEAARRAEDRRRQDEARRAQEERQRKEEAQRRADRRREEDASRRHEEERRQRRLVEDRRQAQHDVQLLGGFAKGDTVGSRITYLQNGVTILKGDIGTVIGACTVDLPDKNRRVSVDFGRYGTLYALVSPDSVAEIYKVPTAMPATKSSLLSVSDPHSTRGTPSTPTISSSDNGSKTTPPQQRPSTAAPAKDGPRSDDTSRPNSASVRTVDDGTAASVHRVSHCDRCGTRFTDRKSLEAHKSDRLSNESLSKCAKVQAEVPPPAAGKPASSTFQAVVDKPEIERTFQVERTIQALKKSSLMNGEPSAYFSTSEMCITYNTTGDRYKVEVYKGAQCETVLMNERQVAQSLTALAAAGRDVESKVLSIPSDH